MIETNHVLVFFVTIIPTVVNGLSACPYSNPHAYYGGAFCCYFAQEKESGGLHRPLTISSTTCKNDHYIKCPNGDDCRSSARETCYLDGEKLNIINSKEDCLENGVGEYEVEWVDEVIEGDGWRVYEQCIKGGGEPENCQVIQSGSVGSTTFFTSPTAGQRRALARAPSARRCNPPRRWRSIRGRRKCRWPRRSG